MFVERFKGKHVSTLMRPNIKAIERINQPGSIIKNQTMLRANTARNINREAYYKNLERGTLYIL